jgi:hypothetical protein
VTSDRRSGFQVSNLRIPGTQIEGAGAIAVGAITLYVVLFVALNTQKVQLKFVFFTVRTNVLLGLLIVAALSFAAGFIVRGQIRTASQAPPATPVIEAAVIEPAPADRPDSSAG